MGVNVNKDSHVIFDISDTKLKHLYDEAERKCLDNIRDFAGKKVLVEGGGYEKIWLETQPMGGEMYAKRNIEVGLNNQLMFMENIREDGRLPGSIALIDNKVVPQYNKFQGFCFPKPALNMYYIAELDKDYLELLYSTLERFDNYLWSVRDSDGDGCLETWCKYDTGEDNAMRYMDAPDGWEEEYPPKGCRVVPMASIDVMSYSYSARETLEKVSRLLGRDEDISYWSLRSKEIKRKIREYLWSEEDSTCYDRDKNHFRMPILYHNTLRAMYWNSIDNDMAEKFVDRHLLNPNEFWTKMPLPSVSVSDSMFRNISANNWSGQCEMLTYQRAIRALENYGYDHLVIELGKILFEALKEDCVFVQQFDPFSARPSMFSEDGTKIDGYGPAMLSVLEYVSRVYGVHREGDELYWGCRTGVESVYEQHLNGHIYRIENSKTGSRGMIDFREIFNTKADVKLITDINGEVIKVIELY
ncbi:MAG: hypothetical protein K6B28_10020 [Lachnospiraceae bacterium]|nr:hypothetical protein [Lachnospiraceae bacterium]